MTNFITRAGLASFKSLTEPTRHAVRIEHAGLVIELPMPSEAAAMRVIRAINYAAAEPRT